MRRNVNRNVFNDRKNVSATIVGSAYVYPLDTRMRRNVNRKGFNDRKNVSATPLPLPHMPANKYYVIVLFWHQSHAVCFVLTLVLISVQRTLFIRLQKPGFMPIVKITPHYNPGFLKPLTTELIAFTFCCRNADFSVHGRCLNQACVYSKDASLPASNNVNNLRRRQRGKGRNTCFSDRRPITDVYTLDWLSPPLAALRERRSRLQRSRAQKRYSSLPVY